MVVLDAIRISDGQQVYLKLIKDDTVHGQELAIHRHLASDTLRRDARNHTIPLLDVVSLPNSGEVVTVTPLLRGFQDPLFDTVGEAVEFFRQIFEVCRGILVIVRGLPN